MNPSELRRLAILKSDVKVNSQEGSPRRLPSIAHCRPASADTDENDGPRSNRLKISFRFCAHRLKSNT